jgi:hypothetical protein
MFEALFQQKDLNSSVLEEVLSSANFGAGRCHKG